MEEEKSSEEMIQPLSKEEIQKVRELINYSEEESLPWLPLYTVLVNNPGFKCITDSSFNTTGYNVSMNNKK